MGKLKAHMVKHSDVKEFECNECGKRFKRKDKLKEHAKRMHLSAGSAAKPPLPACIGSSASPEEIVSKGNCSDKGSTLLQAKKKKMLKRKKSEPKIETRSPSPEKIYETAKPIIMD